jgi:hypothetical protein
MWCDGAERGMTKMLMFPVEEPGSNKLSCSTKNKQTKGGAAAAYRHIIAVSLFQ